MVCAGHPPAVLLGADGRTRLIEEGYGPMLGYPGGRHEAVSIPIAEGDTLVLYTDGLVERRGETIDEGIERLRAVLGEAGGSDVVEHAFAALVSEAPADDAPILAAHRLVPEQRATASRSTQSGVNPSVSKWPR